MLNYLILHGNENMTLEFDAHGFSFKCFVKAARFLEWSKNTFKFAIEVVIPENRNISKPSITIFNFNL